MVMEVNHQAASLWDAIEDDCVSCVDDKKTLAVLLRSTLADMHCMLIGKGSAKAAWEAIKVQYQGPIEFVMDGFGGSGRSLRPWRSRLARRSRTPSASPTSPPRAFSMETLLDPATMTIEEVTGHLRAIEERMDGDQGNSLDNGQLYLTEEQWEARKHQPRDGKGNDHGKK
jgi:hypothetical protein